MKLKANKGTIARTICIVLVLINMGLKAAGKSEIIYSDNEVLEVVTYIVNAVVILQGFWYNNSFTNHAIMSDNLLKELKNGTTGEEE